MDPLKYSDAGHSVSTLEAGSTTIEMENLENSSAMHDLHHHSRPKHEAEELDEVESEDDSGDEGEDEGDRALLGPRNSMRSRERSVSPGRRVSTWKQVQRIVIEVFAPLGGMLSYST